MNDYKYLDEILSTFLLVGICLQADFLENLSTFRRGLITLTYGSN